jgi:DNA polymerase-3 subunit delta
MLIFLYGEDSFRSRQKLLEIKNKFLLTDTIGSGLSIFNYGSGAQISSSKDGRNKQRLLDVLNTPNLLAPKRLVIAQNMIEEATDNEKDDFIMYLKKYEKQIQDDTDLVIIIWEAAQPKKNGKLYKILTKIAKAQNFEKLNGLKLNQWILQKIKEIRKESGISKNALEKIILFVGNDTNFLDKELQKLVDYTDGKVIQSADVDMLVRANLDTNIFNTIDALVNNKKEALRLLEEHFKKGDDPFYIFSMLVYQFRNLLKIAALQEQFPNNEYAIAKATRLHPYVVKKGLSQIRNFSLAQLKEIYKKIGNLDTQIKTGQMDIKLALGKFIAEL